MTFGFAEAEIEGRISGAFREGLAAGLVGTARREMAKEAGKSRDQSRGRVENGQVSGVRSIPI